MAEEAAAEPGGLKALFAGIESLLKLVAGAGVVAALFGVPAVALNHARLGLPGSLIGSDQILRAGVLPTALLAAMLLGAWLWPRLRSGNAAAVAVWFVFVLLGGLLALLVLVGIVIGVTWFWATLADAVAEFRGAPLAEWQAVAIGLAITLASGGVPVLAGMLLDRRRRRGRAAVAPAAADAAGPAPAGPSHLPSLWSPGDLVRTLLVTGPCIYLITYAYGWAFGLLGLADPLGAAGMGDRALIALLVMLVTAAQILLIETTEPVALPRRAQIYRVALAVDYAAIGLVLLLSYTVSIYPALPVAFGGGQPEPVTLWLKAEAVPAAALLGLPGGCTRDDAVLRCDAVWTLPAGREAAVLAAGPDGRLRGIAVPAEAILGQAARDP